MATADTLVRDATTAQRSKRLDAGPWLTALAITAVAIYLLARDAKPEAG